MPNAGALDPARARMASPAPLPGALLTMRARLARALACAAVPLATLGGMMAAYRGVAPLWAGGSTDPSYAYLLNSLLAAELRVPVKTDHPGIPLELLGALTLRSRHMLASGGLPLRDHVLTDPEPFLAATVFALLLVWTAASAFLGWATWRLTGKWPLAALAQASPFVCFEVLRSGVQVMCEPLLVALASVLSGLVLLSLLPDRPPSDSRLGIAMGVVLGLGAATKIVFAPAAIPALAAASTRRARLRIVLWAGLVSGACLLLIAPRVPATAAWMWHLFARSGYHGQGAATVIDPQRYLGGFARLLVAELPLHAAFVAGFVVCLWPKPPHAFPPSARRCASGLFAAWAVTMAAAAKQPQAHYLVTSAGLAPALLVLAFWRLQLNVRARGVRLARLALVLLLLVGVVHATRGARWLMRIRKDAKVGAERVARAAAGRQLDVIQGHRVSTIPAALASGDEWTDLRFSAELRRLYPQFVTFDCAGLHAFGEDLTPREMVAHLKPDGTVLIQDATWRRLGDCPWTARLGQRTLAAEGRDTLHEARLWPPPSPDGSGPWIGGMLLVAGLDGGSGPQRWATGRSTTLIFASTGAALGLEIAAGHGLAGNQALTVVANGLPIHRQSLPRLPAIAHLEVPIDGQPGWNHVEIVYDATVPAPLPAEAALVGYRTRAPRTVLPAVRFETLRLRGPG
jgi:hypothetical protein